MTFLTFLYRSDSWKTTRNAQVMIIKSRRGEGGSSSAGVGAAASDGAATAMPAEVRGGGGARGGLRRMESRPGW